MNCDLAFDLMTDPKGCDSQALRDHLEQCPRCRQMQETLAPALEWMARAGESDLEEKHLSQRRPADAASAQAGRAPTFATAEALEIACASSATLSSRCAAPRVGHWLPAVLRYAALIAIGGLGALALLPREHPGVAVPENDHCRRHEAAEARAASRSSVEIQALIATCAACHAREASPMN